MYRERNRDVQRYRNKLNYLELDVQREKQGYLEIYREKQGNLEIYREKQGHLKIYREKQ